MAQYIITQDYRKRSQKLPSLNNNNCRVDSQHQGRQEFNKQNIRVPQDFLRVASSSHSSLLHPNSNLITPFLNVFHWTLLVPDVIEYDQERNGFFCRKGKFFVKALCNIWLVALAIYLSLICFNDVHEHHHTLKSLVAKITWICYTLFDVAVIKCLRSNGHKIAKLLTEGNRISNFCETIANHGKLERPLPQKKKRINYVKCIVVITCLFAVVYTALFVLYVIIEITAITTNLYCIFMNITSSSSEEKAEWNNGLDLRQKLLERYTTSPLASIVLTIWLLVAFSVEIIWVIYLMMIASGGYYFKRLLKSCMQNIESKSIETCEGIRIFTKITLLLEDFNKLFGTTLLWIVLASVMYTASTLGEYLAGFSNEFMYDMLNLAGFIPFLVALFMGSELHKMGQVLPSLIKRQFLHLDVTDQIQMLHVIQGTSVVQYDALSNTIGLKGQGFFTISYTFLSSLLGVIITYSVLVLQFKVGEIPLTSN